MDTSADSADAVRAAGLLHRADLVLTTIRLPALITSRSPDPDYSAMTALWASLLRPGGHAVVVLRSHRAPNGTLLDIANSVSAIAEAHGLVSVHRCVALTARTHNNHIAPRASVAERRAADRAHAAGAPTGLVAHQTILVMHAVNVMPIDARASDRHLPISAKPQHDNAIPAQIRPSAA